MNFPFKSNMSLTKWSANSTLRKSSNPSMEKIRTYSVTNNEPTTTTKTAEPITTASETTVKNTDEPSISSLEDPVELKHHLKQFTISPQTSSSSSSSSQQPSSSHYLETNSKPINGKSNLDIFLDLTSNPFTTKFEIIGNQQKTDEDKNLIQVFDLTPDINKYLVNAPESSINATKPTDTRSSVERPKSQNFLMITKHIYIGNIASIKNERTMCRLGIEYLIDMSNMRPNDLNQQTLGKLPCLCTKQHSRLYLSVNILETSFKSLFAAFSEVNKFIQRAKKASGCDENQAERKNRVLLFGKDSLSQQVICACAQYLMVEYQMCQDQALTSIFRTAHHSKRFQLDTCYYAYLEQLQSYLRHLSTSMRIPSLCLVEDLVIMEKQSSVEASPKQVIVVDINPKEMSDSQIDLASCSESGTGKSVKRNYKLAWM